MLVHRRQTQICCPVVLRSPKWLYYQTAEPFLTDKVVLAQGYTFINLVTLLSNHVVWPEVAHYPPAKDC